MKCYNCSKEILKEEKQVQIITRDKGEIIGNEHFHWKCWIGYFNECVKRRVEVIKNHAIGLAGRTIENLKGFLNQENLPIR